MTDRLDGYVLQKQPVWHVYPETLQEADRAHPVGRVSPLFKTFRPDCVLCQNGICQQRYVSVAAYWQEPIIVHGLGPWEEVS